MSSVRPSPRTLSLAIAALLLAAVCATSKAQTAQENKPTANEPIVLSTVTPLGEASITLPAGAVITNQEQQGDKIRVWQGPFSATVGMEAIQAEQPPVENLPGNPAAENVQEQPAPTSAPPETSAAPEATPDASPQASVVATGPAMSGMPDWVIPAAGGALLAYALFTTVALLRSRTRAKESSAPVPEAAKEKNAGPVVTIAPKKNAQPAVVSDGGRSIACPLCAKSIPLEKIKKGRNVCPSCNGTFVGE